MNAIILTQSNGPLKPIAIGLGYIMNWIYMFMSHVFHINNVALTIIIFTIIIYMALLPMTYNQQKFSRMTMIMNPELQAIQKKYRGKRDQASVNAMNAETQAVYRKYGVNPSGNCIFLVIQLLILFPLYRVIYNVPAYINSVKETFNPLVTGIMHTPGYGKTMQTFFSSISKGNYVYRGVKLNLDSQTQAHNSIIDVLYKMTNNNWNSLADKFPDLSNVITSTHHQVNAFNNFLGVSVVYSPRNIIATGVHEGHMYLIALAILIPVISLATQFLNIRLAQSVNSAAQSQNSMANQMRIMNYLMPIYSFILVFFLPVGVGVYWIAGAVIRSIQQFIINKHFDKMDIKAIVEQNLKKAEEKQKEKIEKKGVSGQTIANNARINTRNISHSSGSSKKSASSNGPKQVKKNSLAARAASASNIDYDSSSIKYKPGSMAEKAALVNRFNSSDPQTWKKEKEAAAKARAAEAEAQNASRNKNKRKKKKK